MASGKKGKKAKGKTLNLNDFLQENAGSIPVQPIRKSNLNWADEVDDYDGYDRKPINVVLPTAPKASRDYDDITDKVPKDPPYSAYLSNLPYDVDEDEIAEFFRDMKIANMRIPKDDRGGEAKSKGYGYVEFEDRDSLLNALVLPDTTLKNRRIRIEVASNMDNDRRRGGRMEMGRDRGERSESFGDWRSGPRTETNDNDRRGGSYNRDRDGGGFTRDRDGGSFNRDNMRGGDREERSFSRENMRDRDHGRDRDNFRSARESDDKPGAWRNGERNRDQDRDRGFNRDRGNYRDSDRGNFRDSDRGNFRDSDRNRFDDRDDRRGGYGSRRYDNDRDRDRNDGFTRRDDRDSENAPQPRERPRLMLAPRSKPVETLPVKTETVPSASIFGSAKPVDTSQREREIEEKLAKGHSDKPRESSPDKKYPSSDDGDKKDVERSRPSRKIENSPLRDRDNKDGPPPRRNYDDKRGPSRTEQRSPDKTDNRHRSERSDKPRREEKRDKEMPKLAELEPPNFAANNKFAFLDPEDGLD
ncbi:uncharacterized protein isoform X2 [Leptinotarsa decemlineata]|uniref:uncharacterized protein isoform X2 n=1 Tax=Leptinotarsa decemlineata TaxID=7539 RepID=UPI000C2531C6|nr:eukaryotic translation initiation factor 4B-like isoform X2 [Leptinotarsa decemlineata]